MSNKNSDSMNRLVEQLVRRGTAFPPGGNPQSGRNSGPNFGRNPGQSPVNAVGPRRSSSTFILVGLLVWTGLAWLGYLAADGLLAWLAASSGTLLQTGRDVGTAFGAKEVGVAIDSLGAEGWIGSLISLVQTLLAPLIVIVWLIGAVALVILPRIVGRLVGLVGGRR